MYADFYNEKNDIFLIIKVSFFFHFSIIVALLLIVWLRPEKEKPTPIPFFEMVNVMPPQPVAKQQRPTPPEPTPPEPAPPEPAPPEPAPAKPEPVPSAKPEPAPVKPEPKPVAPAPPPEPSMDMPMDMPTDIKKPDMDMPALRTLGSVIMDSQIEAYLKTLHKLIYQNFNPPSGTSIAKGTKSSIQFQIARNGEIIEVTLRSSSGNSIWDRLATRAVQITKPPPLPPSYDAEVLPLIFDFREK
jgi:protein TonB